MKPYSKNILQVLTGLYLSLSAGLAFGMNPVLPLTKPSAEIPMLLEAVRDPDLAFEQISDDTEAQRLKGQCKTDAEALAKSEAPKKSELLEALMKTHTRLSYFYEDVRAGRLPSTDRGDVNASIAFHRSEASRYARELMKLKGDRAQPNYIVTMNLALGGDTSALANPKLHKSVGKDRGHRLDFYALIKSGAKDSPALRKTLGLTMPALGASGQVSGNLYLARLEPQPAAALGRAVKAATKLARVDRENVIAYALALWTARSDGKPQYGKLPFDMTVHSDLAIARAIRERAAIQSSGNNPAALLAFYKSIVEVNRGTPLLASVVERILELQEIEAGKSKNYLGYEKGLVASVELLSDKTAMGRGQEAATTAALGRVQQRYKSLVTGLIAASKSANATKPIRAQTIAIINTYVAGSSLPADRLPLRTELGRIYALNGQHAEAVRTFMDLKKDSSGPKAQEFLAMAISSQRVLAEWPVAAPWDGVPKKNAAARTALADMYEERFSASNNWDDLAQHGLLLINVNNTVKAYAAWTKNLEKNPQGPHAQLAAGMMMISYQAAHSWQKLEDLARLAIKSKMSPIFGRKSVDAFVMLSDALFEGGKEHFAAKRFAPASEKLAEFSKRFKKDGRRPEALFTLARSYHFDNKHPISVETLLALVTEYPNTNYLHDALLLGGDWTVPMAWEDQTIFFYQKFIERFAKDSRVPGIRLSLVELYLGRELFGNAVRLHASQVEDTKVAKADRLNSALAIMAIEERYGDAKYAIWGSNKAKELSGNDPVIVARGIGFDARRAVRSGDMNKIKGLEAALSKLNVKESSVSDTLAQLRFMIAEKQAAETKQEIFNLAQTDVQKTLTNQYNIFLKTQSAYDRVCSAGSTTYCGFAMLRLSDTTRNSLASIENLSIAQTLDEKSVRAFEAQKLSVISAISKASARADSIALGISEKGETTPEWSQEINVNNSDSNLERSHGATGSGYVQWVPVKAEK
ncbi:MAG: hypothetical protein H7249_13765 [Chitinophagaceae bacterium]|nr:hypothetical protein [Oligoflexus sp.]